MRRTYPDHPGPFTWGSHPTGGYHPTRDSNPAAGTNYCVHATSASGNTFAIARTAGVISRICTRVQANGGCPGSGGTGTW